MDKWDFCCRGNVEDGCIICVTSKYTLSTQALDYIKGDDYLERLVKILWPL